MEETAISELWHGDSDTDHTDVASSDPNPSCSTANIQGPAGPGTAEGKLIYHTRKSDILLLLGIIVMLCWPWALFGVLVSRGGIPLSDGFARYVTKHPRTTNFFVTQIGAIVNLIVASFFSTSVLRYSQGWMATKENISFFHLSLIAAFRSHNFPWGLRDIKYLLARKRWIRAALVLACIYAFTLIAPGVTTILTPLPIVKWADLSTGNGTELNFSPDENETSCLEWLNAQAKSMTETCQWKQYKDLNYNTCRDGEMSDILESGRFNVLSKPRGSFNFVTFSGLGVPGGLYASKPLRGTLPLGPNGVDAFNTVNSSLLEHLNAALSNNSNPQAFSPFYVYILHQQGITSNITCIRDLESPVRVYPSAQSAVGTVQFNGTCDGQADVLPNLKTFTSLKSNNSLTFWACKSPTDASSYLLYLRGLQNYAQSIGNLTCTASIRPAIFPINYDSALGVFHAKSHHINETSSITFPGFIDQAVGALGTLIADAQTQELNLVAESVTALGIRNFGLPATGQEADYLPLYEAMMQGVLEYEVAFTRLLYSTFPGRPPSCNRKVTGQTTYTVLGWSVNLGNVGYLFPMTILNLTSLILLLLAMLRMKKGSYKGDPTDPEVLTLATRATPGRRDPDQDNNLGVRLIFPADI